MARSFENARILVTGAAGFIGSHLSERLLAAGASVVGVDNLVTGRKQNLETCFTNPLFTFVEADCSLDPLMYLPLSVIEQRPFDFIFHFASPASPKDFLALAEAIYTVNAVGTMKLLDFLRHHSPQATMVFASTSEAYGDPLQHPQTETYWGNVNPNGPRSCYDESKRFGEMVCGVAHRKYNLDVRIVRIFNTYGPRLRPGEGRVISAFIEQALAGQPYTIYGDGQQTRSYCFVSDLVEVITRYAAAPDLGGETINIGNPDEHTIKETAEIIHRLVHPDGTPPQFEYLPLPENDPVRRQPDISKATRLLEWHPQIDLRSGLLAMIDHFKNTEHL